MSSVFFAPKVYVFKNVHVSRWLIKYPKIGMPTFRHTPFSRNGFFSH